MDPLVANILGQSIGLGMITSAITQAIKITEDVPWLSELAPVRWLLDSVASGKTMNIHICVAVVATLLNAISLYVESGTLVSGVMIISTFGSFLAALGTHNAVTAYVPEK